MAYTGKQIEKIANFYQFKIVNGVKTPYTSTAEIDSTVPVGERYLGQRFQVTNGSVIETWHFQGGVTAANLALVVTAYITQNISPIVNSSQSIL